MARALGRLTIERFGQKFQWQRAPGSGLSDYRPASGDRRSDKGVIAPRLGKYRRKNVIQKNGSIIGMGGFQNAADAIEFMLAGATAVAVGTANFYEPQTALQVIAGIGEFMKRHGMKDVRELVGTVQLGK